MFNVRKFNGDREVATVLYQLPYKLTRFTFPAARHRQPPGPKGIGIEGFSAYYSLR
jgi:hypothetical protein